MIEKWELAEQQKKKGKISKFSCYQPKVRRKIF